MTRRVLSAKQAETIMDQARVLIEENKNAAGITYGYHLRLEQAPLQPDGERPVWESSILSGYYATREQADEAAAAVLTALNSLRWWRK